jgi:hypothetical protein
MIDSIQLSHTVADGLSLALNQDVNTFESLERMAWIVLVLKQLDDTDEWFPRGKWATIQSIECQLDMAAREVAHDVGGRDEYLSRT